MSRNWHRPILQAKELCSQYRTYKAAVKCLRKVFTEVRAQDIWLIQVHSLKMIWRLNWKILKS